MLLVRPSERDTPPFPVDKSHDVPYLASKDWESFANELIECSQPGPEIRRLVQSIPTGESTVDRFAAIYVYLKDRWTYQSDPENGKQQWNQSCEFSVRSGLKGDCEDFACTVFAAMKVADVSGRLVLTKGSGGGHCYYETFVGSDSLVSRALIGDVARRLQMGKIAYRVVDGNIYLALDFGIPDRRVYRDRVIAVIDAKGKVTMVK